MKFEYPIPTSNPADKLGQANTVGFYPIGRLLNWHGGLHVSGRSESAIHAIADGVIIAYRVTNEPIELDGIKFSNNFVLIKHKYVSPEGRELRFYSLYNHLMTFTDLSKKKDVPVFLGEAEYKVKGGVIKGLNLRSSENKEDKFVVPKGMTVELDSNLTPKELNKDHWAQKDTNYKKVKYKDPFTNKVIVDRFMYMGPRHNKKLPNGSYEIITEEDTSSEKGENIRPLTGASIQFVVPNGTKLQLDGFTNTKKNYYKIKSIDGKSYKDLRIFAKSCVKSEGMAITPPKKFNDVVTGEDCAFEVKAGDIIGWTGYCGFANQPKLKDCHVEVFTDQDPAEFITGRAGNKSDIEKTKKFTKIKKGAKLALKYPISFKKDDEIKVLIFSEDANEKYCKIKLHKQEREVDYDLLDYMDGSQKTNDKEEVIAAKYTPGKLKELNVIFNDSLNKKSIIDWVESIKDKDGAVTNRRKVVFTIPAGEHMYWVEKSALGVVAKPQSIIKLEKDLTTLYFREPKQDIFEFTLGQDEIFKNSDLSKTEIQEKDNTWYKIKTFTPEKNEHNFVHYNEIEGFIKKDITEKNINTMCLVSAFNWETFGFKIYKEQPDEFVLNKSIAELTQENSPAFIKSVWNHIDENGDGKLTKRELRNALQDLFPQKKLSKMICYHQSEWGVDYASLKSEIETLLDEGIKKEKNAEKKQKLEDKKQLTLHLVEEKITAFDFWSKVKVPVPNKLPGMPADMIYDPIRDQCRKRNPWEIGFEYEQKDEDEEEYTPFPTSTKVYHFHPIAFVEQMRRIVGEYFLAHSAFANLIAKKESNDNYNLCNKTKGGLSVVNNVNVIETKIKDIQQKQKDRDIFAVGRYQLIPNTLNSSIISLELDIDKNLDEKMQDRIFEKYLITIKRPEIIEYLKGNGNIEDAMYAAAKEWASIGVDKGKKISKDRIAVGGESYYAGDGLNKAHISPDQIKKVLIKSKSK
ncbi:hypothetical protein ACT3CE_18205 [Marinifilum sp. RC60d5]|uniref:hypothetical protein n=1 Tax=Marinifilum sp. RC60d5 TaxID=3458414 RepID=UPI004037092C